MLSSGREYGGAVPGSLARGRDPIKEVEISDGDGSDEAAAGGCDEEQGHCVSSDSPKKRSINQVTTRRQALTSKSGQRDLMEQQSMEQKLQ